MRLPVHAQAFGRKADCCEIPCWQSHRTRLTTHSMVIIIVVVGVGTIESEAPNSLNSTL